MESDGVIRERGATATGEVSPTSGLGGKAPSAGRDANGKFVNRPGPGRPSERLLALRERYKRETALATAQALADDIPRLEDELAALDDEIEEAEAAFLDRIAPTVKHRAEVDMCLARARVGKEYIVNPAAFGDRLSPRERLRINTHNRLAGLPHLIAGAKRELELCPAPSDSIVACMADSELWEQSHRHRQATNRVLELQNELAKLERIRDTELSL